MADLRTPALSADRAREALTCHGKLLGCRPDPQDLLTDLAHLAAIDGWDFERACEDALINRDNELGCAQLALQPEAA